jgi:hypothetical protein
MEPCASRQGLMPKGPSTLQFGGLTAKMKALTYPGMRYHTYKSILSNNSASCYILQAA